MRNMLVFTALASGAVAIAAFAAVAADDKTGKGAGKLDGGYTIVSGERDGRPLPADRVAGHALKFTGDRVVVTDKNNKETYVASYTLDTGKTPWAIKMKSTVPPNGGEATGLVKKDGDTVTLIYALPGGAAPTEFKTTDRQNLFVMKNLNKANK
jgi:uncharacterized protein (TIGR03067 family)